MVTITVLFSRSSSKLEEACDMYVRAANMFKMAKNWSGKRAILSSFLFIYVVMVPSFNSPPRPLSCRNCILQSGSPSPANAEQTRCGNQSDRCWKRLQKSRSTRWVLLVWIQGGLLLKLKPLCFYLSGGVIQSRYSQQSFILIKALWSSCMDLRCLSVVCLFSILTIYEGSGGGRPSVVGFNSPFWPLRSRP